MQFSVIIPLYNKERHIIRAVNSVLNQTYKEFEIVIIDDGSTDSSFNVISGINDYRIKIFQQRNSGVSVARNRGVAEAKYNYIAFLDADDEWECEHLEIISMLIKKYPTASVFATSFKYHYENYIKIARNYYEFEENWNGVIDDFFKCSIKYPLLWTSCVVVLKSAFNSVNGFPEGIRYGEDLELWCKLALNYKIAYFNKVCAIYYLDSDNRSISQTKCLKYSFANYVEEKYLLDERNKNQSLYYKEYMIKIVVRKIQYLISYNKSKQARKLIRKYWYSKYNRKRLIITYIASYISIEIIDKLLELKNKIYMKKRGK